VRRFIGSALPLVPSNRAALSLLDLDQPVACLLVTGDESAGLSLLRVTLRTQPSDAAITVHPLVDFGFAFETLNVNRLDTRTLGHDIPIVFGNSHRFETYFCFSHALCYGVNTI
jgi:hypothetical protein